MLGRIGGRYTFAPSRVSSPVAPMGKVKYAGAITNAPQGCPQGYRSAKLPSGQYGCIATVD